MLKKSLVLLVSSSSALFADSCNCCCEPQETCPTTFDRCGPITVSARPSNLDSGFYVTADFLWWQAQEGGAEWSYNGNNQELPTVGGPDEKANLKNNSVKFHWDPGFRAGLGYNFEYDGWDAEVYYSWFRTSKKESVSSPFSQTNPNTVGFSLQAIVPLHTDINTATEASIDWSIHYSVVDAELGRNFFVSRHLSLRPHIGLKTGWINQHIKTHLLAASSSTNFPGPVDNQKKSDFWGIGPSGGINTRWYLATFGCDQHFSLFGDFSGALMWGKFDVKEQEIEPGFATDATNHINIHGINTHLIVPMIQAQLGLGWDTGFYDECFHVALNVGYEIQYWFRQNQMLNVLPNFFFGQIYYIYQRQSEDLRFHGLTVNLKVDF